MPDVIPFDRPHDRPRTNRTPDIVAQTRDLVFEGGGRRLVDGISATLTRDTRTIIMGPNGAGKSLLLRLLHGLIEPASGEVLWDGRRLDAHTRREQAMVFQRPVLLRRSVAANVRFALKLRGHVVADDIVRALDEVGLADRADQPARLLSGGEQQRLALARALATRPRTLFLDEPTANLDPSATAMIEAVVERAHARGTKIVFVTHDIGQARRLADDVLFLHRGRVSEHTPADLFFAKPATRAAADFLDGRLVLR